ncbi:subtilase-type protease inhibitor [Streptomyces sp. NBC_00820]|uniref:SSI family serine proteinase inhibitor n=1 Tax=Streptomyces sp. NBC_00820 TaxID=2975842 RepID=UPI002ED040D2|nr:subtilase-type protease inhibitor [Streptomyces sp. NBC_00820]
MVSFLPGVPRDVLVSSLAAAVSSLAALGAAPAAAVSASIPTSTPASVMPPPVRTEDRAGDHLTVVVRQAGPGRDGTYEVFCHPAAGRHPNVEGACRVLDENTRWGQDTFAPVPPGSICTMIYGGPATAHVTGTWAGRPVDARYDRGNGCEIGRWDRLVPFLPKIDASA